jgi:N-acetylglucosamine malate deacetylase 1
MTTQKTALRVFAIAAHPDDIEFVMGGTLLLLAKKGCEIHYMNIANGSCGSIELGPEEIAAVRLEEAKNAVKHMGAVFHPPLVKDLEIFYEKSLIARVSSIVRQVAPDIVLAPSPVDYMEDHMNASRLAVTATFTRTIRNLPVDPAHDPVTEEAVLYHAQPYGNRDQIDRLIAPDLFINIGSVIDEKTAMLAEHKSQKSWLDYSQGVGAYLEAMKMQSREVGRLSTRCEYAEGWRRHSSLGFCSPDADPLAEILKDNVVNPMSD